MQVVALPQPDCDVTLLRRSAETAIKKLARVEGVSIDACITQLLANSAAQLQWYVASKGEVPLSNPKLLAAQAAMLRADDVATIAKASGVSDDAALTIIERSEQTAIDSKDPDAVILDPDIQAALYLAICDLRKRAGGKLANVLGAMRSMSKADNFTLNVGGMLSDPSFLQRGRFDNFDIPIPTGGPDITDVGGSTDDTDTSGGGFDWSSIGDIFGSVMDGIDKVGGTSTSIGDAINGVIDKIKGAGSDVASTGIQDALMKKLPVILLGILVVAVLIIIIAKYAGKSK